jgi:hypothetical protein
MERRQFIPGLKSRVLLPERQMGLDVTKTLKDVGIVLEWPPKNITYQIAFAACLKKE